MKKFFKILGIVLLVLIAIIIATPFLFKGQLLEITKEQINKNVNAKVEFKDFGLSIFSSFPDLTVTLDELSVVGVDKFKGDTLLSLKQLYADVDIMSVINGDQIKILAIELNTPKINAIVMRDSSANWDIAKPSEPTPDDTAAATGETKFSMALKSFKIIDACLSFTDSTSNTFAVVDTLNFSLEGDFTQDVTSIKTLTDIKALTAAAGGVTYMKKGALNFKVDLDADLKNMKFTFKENLFRINAFELGLDGWVAMPDSNNINMDVRFNAPKIEFKNLLSLVPGVFMAGFENIKTAGKLSFNGSAKGTFNSVQEIYPSFTFNLLVDNAMFKYPQVPGSVQNIGLNLAVYNKSNALDSTVVDLKKLHIEFAENPFDITLLVRTPISDPQIACGFIGKIDLAKMKEFIPLEKTTLTGLITSNITVDGRLSQIEKEQYEEFKALGTLQIQDLNYKSADFPQGATISNMMMEFSPRYVDLKTLDVVVGKSDFHLDGKLEKFIPYALKGDTLQGQLTFSSTMLDANELMGTDTTKAVEDTAASTPMSVIEVPGNINFVLNTSLGTILYDKLNISNLKGNIIVKNSKADLSNLSMNLLGGGLRLNGYYETKDITKPSFNFGMDISNFDISQTFAAFNTVQKLAPFAKNCFGAFSTNLTIGSLLGQDMMPVFNTLNGAGGLSTKSVEVKGSDIQAKLAEVSKNEELKQMMVKDVMLKFTITNGNLEIHPFTTKINDMKAEFGGTTNLDQTINYKLAMQVPRSKFGSAANQVVDGLLAQAASKGVNAKLGETINVDLFIKNTVTDPKVSMALGQQSGSSVVNSVTDQAKAELERQRAELEAKGRAEAERLRAENEAKARAEADRIRAEAEAKVKREAEAQKNRLQEEAKNKLKKMW